MRRAILEPSQTFFETQGTCFYESLGTKTFYWTRPLRSCKSKKNQLVNTWNGCGLGNSRISVPQLPKYPCRRVAFDDLPLKYPSLAMFCFHSPECQKCSNIIIAFNKEANALSFFETRKLRSLHCKWGFSFGLIYVFGYWKNKK